MPVKHKEAVEEHLAERYLLGEMAPGDIEQFEQHFFECPECAAAVEEGQGLFANGRELMRTAPRMAEERQRQPLWASLKLWLSTPMGFVPVTACLFLAALAGYQNTVTIPALQRVHEAAQIVPAFQLIAATRGDAPAVTVPRGASSFVLSIDVPPDAQFTLYELGLTSAGRTVFQVKAAAPAAGQPVTILVPAREMTPGAFDLVVSAVGADGQKRERVSVFPFNLQFK